VSFTYETQAKLVEIGGPSLPPSLPPPLLTLAPLIYTSSTRLSFPCTFVLVESLKIRFILSSASSSRPRYNSPVRVSTVTIPP